MLLTMTWIDGLLIFISILLVYFLGLLLLKRKGLFEKYNLGLMGPFLLIKTKRGIGFLKKISQKKRFWRGYGNFAIILSSIIMVVMVVFLVWQLNLLAQIPAELKSELPGPEFILILPGINPLLPIDYLFYIIVAFIVAIIVHEFSHGILTFVGDLKVKSMGIAYMIIPMGAFVEPDEEELQNTKISKRMRVFAVGPTANFIVVLVCLLLFSFVFIGSLQPVTDGVVIVTTADDSPADNYGFNAGMILTSLNNTTIQSYNDYFYAINSTRAQQEVEVDYYWKGEQSKKVVLSDKYDEYEKRLPEYNNVSFKGKGYFGIRPEPNGIDTVLSALSNPFGYNMMNRFFYIIAIPIMGYFDGYNPIVSPFTESYMITGPLSFLPETVFWGAVNVLYWIFWLNLMVGLFNVLPMVPLDGGYLFNDYIRFVIKKFKKGITKERLDKIVGNVSLVVSLIILFIVIFPVIFKYI